MTVRPRRAAVAGYFYPADAASLRSAVTALMEDAAAAAPAAADDDDRRTMPKAIIAPHAGYRYSGPVAASAYTALAADRGAVRTVILAGPSHFTAIDGVAVPGADAFLSPLGPLAVDDDARQAALALDGVEIDDRAHAGEHSIEVHLPFLTEVLGHVTVLPLLVQSPGVGALADVLDTLWNGDGTRIVISTDLSHYHDHVTAQTLDRRTADAICRLSPLEPEWACGAAAVQAMLIAARRHHLGVRLLDLRTSADTVGDPDRVVGYGAFALDAPAVA
jgi:AmmeMemoRadiSam system protein B